MHLDGVFSFSNCLIHVDLRLLRNVEFDGVRVDWSVDLLGRLELGQTTEQLDDETAV